MPKKTDRPEMTHELNVARRVQREREQRGMTYEAVARAMTTIGCNMQASSVFKIEKGDPPRRITVDEYLAFAKVFGLAPQDLLVPWEVSDRKDIKKLLDSHRRATERWIKPWSLMLDYERQLQELLNGDEEALEAIWPQIKDSRDALVAMSWQGVPLFLDVKVDS